MDLVNGWWLPSGDTYFAQFTKGGKGFQLDHLELAYKHVRQWRVAVDVGAHVGFWTRSMSRKFREVHAFEATRETYECLQRNCEIDNVATQYMALGKEHGSCCMTSDGGKRLGNSGANYVKLALDAREVQMMPLDSYPLGHLDLLKVDVEGFEHNVLIGAKESIFQHSPVIIMETDKHFAKDRYGVPDDYADRLLRDWGWKPVEHIRPDTVYVRAV